MATPNKHPASQQGRTPSQLTGATPPVSTPFSNPAQAAFSPRGPRSSPQQFKKSPAASMLGQLSNGGLAFDSPSTAAALGLAGPADLPADGDPTDELRDMRPITRDDDKLRRLETILDILDKSKGLVSEAGLERLGQRNGFDCLLEDYTASDGRKMRALIIAGSSTQIDIILDNNIVQNVTLAFPESSESTTKYMEPASKILLNDLRLPPNQSPLTKTLDRFAYNLEVLAALDKLSIMPSFDCRAALVGLYISLKKIHEWDVSKLREESSKSEKLLSLLAMCSKNGLPALHAGDRVGLALQYWKERRLVPPEAEKTTSFAEKREKIWSAAIACSPMPMDGLQIPPARVSEEWISKDIVKDDGFGGDAKSFPLDWQEPPNTTIPPPEEGKNPAGVEIIQADLSSMRVAPVVFTVTFDPPIIVPQNDWVRLYACANAEPPPPPYRVPTFDQLYFPIPPGVQHDPSEHRSIKRERQVPVFDKDGKATIRTHHNSLFIYKQIYSMHMSHVVISHPKQLTSMLPILRQWAFTSTLLENSFPSGEPNPTEAESPEQLGSKQPGNISSRDEKDMLAAFMGSPSQTENSETPTAENALNLDVIVWVHPAPHFQVVFPFRNSKASITLQILENGIVEVVDENVLTQGDGAKDETNKVTRDILGKALEHMEDLCKWAEWIRSRLS